MFNKNAKERRYLFSIDGVPGPGKTAVSSIVGVKRKGPFTLDMARKSGGLREVWRNILSPRVLKIYIPLSAVSGLRYATKRQREAIFDRSPISLAVFQDLDKKLTAEQVKRNARKWADFYKGKKLDTIFLLDIDPDEAAKRVKEREKRERLGFTLEPETIKETARRYAIAADEFRRQGYDVQVIKVTPEMTKEQVAEEIRKRMKEKMKTT